MRPPGGVPVDGHQVPLVAPLGQLPLQLLPRQLLPLQRPLLVVLALAPVPPTQRPLQGPEEAARTAQVTKIQINSKKSGSLVKSFAVRVTPMGIVKSVPKTD